MKLQNLLGTLLCTLALGSASTAMAQSADSKITAAVEGAFVLPTGDWSDVAGPGLGVMVRGAMEIQPKLQVTGRLGYIHHLATETLGVDLNTTEILVLGGIRYDIGPVLLDVATGINNWSFKVEGNGVSGDESETRIPLLLGAVFPVSTVEVGANIFVPNLLLNEDEEDVQLGLMATVSYRFL